MDGDLVTGDDVVVAVEATVGMLETVEPEHPGWDGAAGSLEWSCRVTVAHVADCLYWYAANLARRSTGNVITPDVPTDWRPAKLVDAVRSAGAVLAAAVAAAAPEDRGWHPFGVADRSGFAAMGCDEVLVHGWDLARGLSAPGDPRPFAVPPDVAGRVARRLFPWAPQEVDGVATLLWANGRRSLPGVADTPPGWVWHCAPLAEWDGTSPLDRVGGQASSAGTA